MGNIESSEPERTVESLQAQLSALNTELSFYKRLVASVRDGLWHRNIETDELWVSPRWWQMLGYASADVPKTFEEFKKLVHPDDLSAIQEALSAHLEKSASEYQCQFRLQSADKTWRTIVSRGLATRGETGGANKYLSGSHTDITMIRHEDQQRRRMLQIYDSVFHSIPHLIVVKGPDHKFIYCNKALAEFWGEPDHRKMEGKCDADYNEDIHEVSEYLAADDLVRQTKRPLPISVEHNTDCKGVKRWLTTIKVPLEREDGRVDVVVVATFIDDLMKMDERVRKQEEIANLARKIAHKLGTRIFALESLVSIRRDDPNKEDLRAAFDDLIQFKDDFLRLTDDKLNPEEFNLFSCVHRAIKPFADKCKITLNLKDVSRTDQGFLKNFDADEFTIVADEKKLSDVFTEIARNSLRWAKETQLHRLNVSVQAILAPGPSMANIPSVRNSTRQKLQVVFDDNGIGVDPRFKQKIFESFVSSVTPKDGYSPDEVGASTGLGLAIAYEVMKAHGGTILENGQFKQGARFVISLPLIPTT